MLTGGSMDNFVREFGKADVPAILEGEGPDGMKPSRLILLQILLIHVTSVLFYTPPSMGNAENMEYLLA